MSIERTKVSQSSALKFTGNDARGVCLGACRRWVKAALEGSLVPGETVYDIIGSDTIQELLESHKKRNNKSEKGMKEFDLTVTKREGGGPFKKFTRLRTRQDVIDHVLTVPGAYIIRGGCVEGRACLRLQQYQQGPPAVLRPQHG